MRSGTLGGSYALSIPVKPGRREGGEGRGEGRGGEGEGRGGEREGGEGEGGEGEGGVLSEHLKLWRSS